MKLLGLSQSHCSKGHPISVGKKDQNVHMCVCMWQARGFTRGFTRAFVALAKAPLTKDSRAFQALAKAPLAKGFCKDPSSKGLLQKPL